MVKIYNENEDADGKLEVEFRIQGQDWKTTVSNNSPAGKQVEFVQDSEYLLKIGNDFEGVVNSFQLLTPQAHLLTTNAIMCKPQIQLFNND